MPLQTGPLGLVETDENQPVVGILPQIGASGAVRGWLDFGLSAYERIQQARNQPGNALAEQQAVINMESLPENPGEAPQNIQAQITGSAAPRVSVPRASGAKPRSYLTG